MTLLNLHTHTPLPAGEHAISSRGLHPWHVDAHWADRLAAIAAATDWLILGECGLDKLCQTPYSLQTTAFEAQIALSEAMHKPVLIHCVHAMDDVLRLHARATQPWVWHGFRGKPEMLRQLLRAGFHVSFGPRHNTESLAACPTDRLFLETDDTALPILPLYEQAAAVKGLTPSQLAASIWHNAEVLTGLPASALGKA